MSSSVDTNHGRPVKYATAAANDEETHRAAVRSAMAGDQAERPGTSRNLEYTHSRYRLLRSQVHAERRDIWIRFGWVTPTLLIDKVSFR